MLTYPIIYPNFICLSTELSPINKISDTTNDTNLVLTKIIKTFAKTYETLIGEIYYTTKLYTNRAYDNFFAEISQSFETNFPLQRLSRRGSKDKIWITRGLPNFIFINKTSPINKISDRPMIRIYSDKNNKNFCENLRNVDWGNILYNETDT